MVIILQCPCALSPYQPAPAVLVLAEWDGVYIVTRQHLQTGELTSTYVAGSMSAADKEFRRRLELERREAETYGWADAAVIVKKEGENLANSVMGNNEADSCLALTFNSEQFHVIAHCGRFFRYEIEENGRQGGDIGINAPPDEPGVYVFENGQFIGGGWNPRTMTQEDSFLFGEWRVATAADYKRFDIDISRFVSPLNVPMHVLMSEHTTLLVEALDTLKLVEDNATAQVAELCRRINAALSSYR